MRSEPIHAFSGYKLLEICDKSGYWISFRATKGEGPAPLRIKVLEVQAPSATSMARFKHEAALIRGVDTDVIDKIMYLNENDGKPAPVMEAFDGVPLTEALTHEWRRFHDP